MTQRSLRPIAAVLFDVGGVLLRLRPEDSFAAFAQIGAPGFDRIWHEDTEKKSLHQFEVGAIDAAQFRREINEALNTTLSDDAFDQAFRAMLGPIDPSHFSLLRALQKTHRLYILSNNNDLHLPAIEQRYPHLLGHFSRAFFSQRIGLRKPDPQAFVASLQQMQLPAEQTLFIDDSPANIEAAQQLGFACCLLPRNGDLPAAIGPLL